LGENFKEEAGTMNPRNFVRIGAIAALLALSVVGTPPLHAHAQDNNDEGIELDCPLAGNWVANGGYVIAKAPDGYYHRVYCNNGTWVDGGPILTYLTTPPSSHSPTAPAQGPARLGALGS
jgi:hypothetical protein